MGERRAAASALLGVLTAAFAVWLFLGAGSLLRDREQALPIAEERLPIHVSLGGDDDAAFGEARGPAAERKPGLVINEFLAANRRASVDEEGKAEDWVELFNAGDEPIDLGGYALSDEPENPKKWVFPSHVIEPGGYEVVWLSGKDRYAPPAEAIVTDSGRNAFEPAWVRSGARWHYTTDRRTRELPPEWTTLEFDPRSGFQTGRSGFGYGDNDDRTPVSSDTLNVFARTEFTVDEPSAVHSLVLQIDYDDGFVAYLNGTRVAAANSPVDHPTAGTIATRKHEAGEAERFDLTKHRGLLRPGKNVLAIVGLNDTDSSDMSLRPELGRLQSIFHTNFSLAKEGGALLLTDPAGEQVDSVEYPEQVPDHTFGRSPNGSGGWVSFVTPSPAKANRHEPFADTVANEVVFSPIEPAADGTALVRATVELSIAIDRPAARIHFTTDGTTPTLRSPRFSAPFEIDRTTVIRAAVFERGERATPVFAKTYFLGARPPLDIVSIVMEPPDFALVHGNSNARGRAFERPAHFEILTPDGTVRAAGGLGIRLHGGAGRNGNLETKKAYKVYFRGTYGMKRLKLRLFPDSEIDEFDKLVLRSGFNDRLRPRRGSYNGRFGYIRDEVVRDLHRDLGGIAGHGTWCLLYVNGARRGLYNIVERLDEEFLESHVGGTDWDVIKTGEEVLAGSDEHWIQLKNLIRSGDFSNDSEFAELASVIDLDDVTRYLILNTWAQNHDWPHNNWYAVRSTELGGKWRFLCWDAEWGLGLNPSGYSEDSLSFALQRGGVLTDLFRALFQNAGYRTEFEAALERALAGPLAPDAVVARIEAEADAIDPAMRHELATLAKNVFKGRAPRRSSRFGSSREFERARLAEERARLQAIEGWVESAYSTWQRNVNDMRTFARVRGAAFRELARSSLEGTRSSVHENGERLPGAIERFRFQEIEIDGQRVLIAPPR